MTQPLPVTQMIPPPAPPSEDATGHQPDLFDRAVLLNLTLKKLGNRRRVKQSQVGKRDSGAHVEVDANETKLIAASKQLIDSSEYDAIGALFGEVRQYIYSRCLPSPFRQGVYFLPLGLIPEAEARLTVFRAQLETLVERLANVYPGYVAIAARCLGGLYDAADYPDVAAVRAAFDMEWSYQTVSTPRVLEQINRTIYARETESARRRIEEATSEITAAMRQAMTEMVEHMVERLTPTDGKAKKFHDSSVEKFQDFLATFEARNIAGDQELALLAGRARQLLKGVEPQALRDSEITRNRVRAGLDEVKAQLDTMVIARPARRLIFDEAEN